MCGVLDTDAVRKALNQAVLEVVIHQLTDLPARYRQPRSGARATDLVRTEGTRNLVDASLACGVRRIIAQSDRRVSAVCRRGTFA